MTREWVGARRLPENVKRTMISSGQKVKEFYYSSEYQLALKALDGGADRDIRIFEGK